MMSESVMQERQPPRATGFGLGGDHAKPNWIPSSSFLEVTYNKAGVEYIDTTCVLLFFLPRRTVLGTTARRCKEQHDAE